MKNRKKTVYEKYRSNMSGHVFVVSEWLPKENYEEKLWDVLKEVMALTKKKRK